MCSISRKKRTLTLVALALALLLQQHHPVHGEEPSQGCGGSREQLANLSKLLDPSGQLASLILGFKPAPDTVQSAASEPILSITTVPAKATSTNVRLDSSSEPASASLAINPTTPMSEPVPTPTSVSSSPATPTGAPIPAAAPANPSAQAVEPVILSPRREESSNVTVNLILQLASDAKIDELINNPDSASSIKSSSLSTTSSMPESLTTSNILISASETPSTNQSQELITASPTPSPISINTTSISSISVAGSQSEMVAATTMSPQPNVQQNAI